MSQTLGFVRQQANFSEHLKKVERSLVFKDCRLVIGISRRSSNFYSEIPKVGKSPKIHLTNQSWALHCYLVNRYVISL